jgi:hypothetical protein
MLLDRVLGKPGHLKYCLSLVLARRRLWAWPNFSSVGCLPFCDAASRSVPLAAISEFSSWKTQEDVLIDTNKGVVFHDPDTGFKPMRVEGAPQFRNLTAGSGFAWAITDSQTFLFEHDGTFKRFDLALTTISGGADTNPWGINAQSEVFFFDGDAREFRKVTEMRLDAISVGASFPARNEVQMWGLKLRDPNSLIREHDIFRAFLTAELADLCFRADSGGTDARLCGCGRRLGDKRQSRSLPVHQRSVRAKRPENAAHCHFGWKGHGLGLGPQHVGAAAPLITPYGETETSGSFVKVG